jgi:hypothetical protein
VVDQMQPVLQEVIGLIQQSIGTVNDDILQMPFDSIPLVGELHKTCVDSDSLTALSVMALAIALPADALYFAAFERHPFETDADLANYQAAFTADWLLQESGLVGAGTLSGIEVPPEDRLVISQVLGIVLAVTYLVLSFAHPLI